MNARSPLCGFLLFLALSCFSPYRADALTIAQGGGPADNPNREGMYFSAAMVDGKPAAAWLGDHYGAIKYARALDAQGNAWGPATVLDSGLQVGLHVELKVVHGKPIVCYHHSDSRKFRYVRAADAAGSVWNPPVLVESYELEVSDIRVETVDGNPAILFSGGIGGYLNIIRASDADGSEWGPPWQISIGFGEVKSPSLRIVEGMPAVAFADGWGVWYRRATNPAGTAWGEKVKLSRAVSGAYSALEIVDGRPVVAFFELFSEFPAFVRAADTTGGEWGTPVMLDSEGHAAHHVSMTIVNGKPVIAYSSPAPSPDVRIVQSTDGSASAWGAPVTVGRTPGAGNFGARLRLLDVQGRPALVYYDDTRYELKYVRALADTGSGGAIWPPEPAAEQPPGTVLAFAAPAAFGVVPPGTAKELPFALTNPNSGSAAAVIQSATITGPDAGEFSFVISPAGASLAATQAVPFSMRYAPMTAGLKNATVLLEIASGGTVSSFSIPLTGNSAPDISLEFPSGSVLTEMAPLVLTLTPPGRTRDLVFALRNPGAADLAGLAFTIDGPNADEFSLTGPLPATVAHGGNTTVTVRHAPASSGSKTATLHLASNVTGDKNPFDLTLKMVPGLPDPAFNPDIQASYALTCVAVQPDGKILAGGYDKLVRLHPDGSIDASFAAPDPDGQVKAIVVQRDGSILVSGDFIRWGDKVQHGVARLHANGSLDESFAPAGMEYINCMALQPDGKIILGGTRFFFPDQPRRRLMRLFPDGSDDSSFDVTPDGDVLCVAVQPDGKILAGGRFTSLNGFAASRLGRLNPDGTPDFFLSDFDERVNALTLQTDGKIVAGGFFATGQFEQGGAFFGRGIARLQADGTRDANYTFGMFDTVEVKSLALQADGRCLVAGTYFVPGIGPSTRLMRFQTDGKLDPDFQMLTDGIINGVALQADGKALAVGEFFFAGGILRKRMVRVDNDFGTARLEAASTSALRWWREGGAPEVQGVTFEIRNPVSSAWMPLGSGTRVPGGWALTGLQLPAAGTFRARGTAGGSLMETVFSNLPPLEAWREQHFHSPANTGDGANDADPDHDGLTNLVEFAFGLSPVSQAEATLPGFTHDGTALAVSFSALAGRDSVILYGAEWSPTMLAGTWSAVTDTGAGGAHVFSIPAGSSRGFVRFVLKPR